MEGEDDLFINLLNNFDYQSPEYGTSHDWSMTPETTQEPNNIAQHGVGPHSVSDHQNIGQSIGFGNQSIFDHQYVGSSTGVAHDQLNLVSENFGNNSGQQQYINNQICGESGTVNPILQSHQIQLGVGNNNGSVSMLLEDDLQSQIVQNPYVFKQDILGNNITEPTQIQNTMYPGNTSAYFKEFLSRNGLRSMSMPILMGSSHNNWNMDANPRRQPIKNGVYDPKYKDMGLHIDPHLRMFESVMLSKKRKDAEDNNIDITMS